MALAELGLLEELLLLELLEVGDGGGSAVTAMVVASRLHWWPKGSSSGSLGRSCSRPRGAGVRRRRSQDPPPVLAYLYPLAKLKLGSNAVWPGSSSGRRLSNIFASRVRCIAFSATLLFPGLLLSLNALTLLALGGFLGLLRWLKSMALAELGLLEELLLLELLERSLGSMVLGFLRLALLWLLRLGPGLAASPSVEVGDGANCTWVLR